MPNKPYRRPILQMLDEDYPRQGGSKRFLAMLDEGATTLEIMDRFKVKSFNTIYLWKKRLKEEGTSVK